MYVTENHQWSNCCQMSPMLYSWASLTFTYIQFDIIFLCVTRTLLKSPDHHAVWISHFPHACYRSSFKSTPVLSILFSYIHCNTIFLWQETNFHTCTKQRVKLWACEQESWSNWIQKFREQVYLCLYTSFPFK